MVKFTKIPFKNNKLNKIPNKHPSNLILSKQFTQYFNNFNQNNLLINSNKFFLQDKYTYILNTKKLLPYFFNLTLQSRLNKLNSLNKELLYTRKRGLININNLLKPWSLYRINFFLSRKTFLMFKLIRKQKKQLRKFLPLRFFSKFKKRLLYKYSNKKNIFIKRRKSKMFFFKKHANFYYKGRKKKFISYRLRKVIKKKKKNFNIKSIIYLKSFIQNNNIINLNYLLKIKHKKKLYTKRFFKNRSKRFFKNRKIIKKTISRSPYFKFYNSKKKISIYKIGLSLFRILKPKSNRFFKLNISKLNTKWNLKQYFNKYNNYSFKSSRILYPFSKYVRFKKTLDINNNWIFNIKYINPVYTKKLKLYYNIILTQPLLTSTSLMSFKLNFFFKLYKTNFNLPYTKVWSLTKVINQNNFLLSNTADYTKKIKPNIQSSSSVSSRIKKYSFIRFNPYYEIPSKKKWLVKKLSVELNNFLIFNSSTNLKFNNKKVRLATSGLKIDGYKVFSQYMKRRSIKRWLNRTHNLIPGLGYMPALPLLYFEDIPGFLLNYDTETLYNHAPCPTIPSTYHTIINFSTPTLKNFKLVTFNMSKGDSYFELNNILNPVLVNSNIINKPLKKIVKNTSIRDSVKNYSYYASTKHINPLEGINQLSFKKVLLKDKRTKIWSKIKRIKYNTYKYKKPKKFIRKNFKIFLKSKKIKKWTRSKFKDFLNKHNIETSTSLYTNPIFYKKKKIFTELKTIKRFKKISGKIFWRQFFKNTLRGYNFYKSDKMDYFNNLHQSNLLTLSTDSLQKPLNSKNKTFFESIFLNFSNLNKFIYSNQVLIRLLKNRFFFKNFLLKLNTFISPKSVIISLIQSLARSTRNFFFNDRILKYRKSNLIPLTCFNFEVQRFVVHHVRGGLWLMVSTQTITTLLIRFVENVSGRKALLRFSPNAFKFLTVKDHARAIAWEPRIKSWQLLLGPKFFAAESLKLIGVMLRSRDPYFFSRWVVIVSARLDFFNHRKFFRLIRLLLKWYYSLFFDEFGLTGIKLKFKGKISVAGNSRKRSQFARAGITSNSKVSNRVTSDINYIYTFTGAVAFQIWLYF